MYAYIYIYIYIIITCAAQECGFEKRSDSKILYCPAAEVGKGTNISNFDKEKWMVLSFETIKANNIL